MFEAIIYLFWSLIRVPNLGNLLSSAFLIFYLILSGLLDMVISLFGKIIEMIGAI